MNYHYRPFPDWLSRALCSNENDDWEWWSIPLRHRNTRCGRRFFVWKICLCVFSFIIIISSLRALSASRWQRNAHGGPQECSHSFCTHFARSRPPRPTTSSIRPIERAHTHSPIKTALILAPRNELTTQHDDRAESPSHTSGGDGKLM